MGCGAFPLPAPLKSLSHSFSLPHRQDEKYWNRRYKNNEAAKRSRDARRLKENQITVRAAFLEKENAVLRQEVASIRQELSRGALFPPSPAPGLSPCGGAWAPADGGDWPGPGARRDMGSEPDPAPPSRAEVGSLADSFPGSGPECGGGGLNW
uniref:BZIP domain-containing protein n=1 Tax=Chelydra serpentina TaxID=8475 RepID=A0A8C3S9C7_CHESE